LQRAASIISQDPSFSTGAEAAAENVLHESEEGNARIKPQATDWVPYIISDNDEPNILIVSYLIKNEMVRDVGGSS
jgi:hypothetical protein